MKFACLFFLLAITAPAAAQFKATPVLAERLKAVEHVPIVARESERSTMTMAAGGVVGGAIGFLGGAFAGYWVERGVTGCMGDYCGLLGAMTFALAGEVALVPLGVHLANGRRGDYRAALGPSLGAAAVGVAAAAMGGDVIAPFLLVATPIAQVINSVSIEKRTSK